jgi:hypothetical protein
MNCPGWQRVGRWVTRWGVEVGLFGGLWERWIDALESGMGIQIRRILHGERCNTTRKLSLCDTYIATFENNRRNVHIFMIIATVYAAVFTSVAMF